MLIELDWITSYVFENVAYSRKTFANASLLDAHFVLRNRTLAFQKTLVLNHRDCCA